MALTPEEMEELKGLLKAERAEVEPPSLESGEVPESPETLGETFGDIAIGGAQGLTAGFADEIAGTATVAWQKATGDERPYEEIYKEARDIVRGRTSEARERSPFTTFVAEIAGASANPALRAGGLAKTAAQSFITGLGESESETPEDMAIDATLTSTVGTAGHIAGDLIKKPFQNPLKIRARFTGQRKKDFQRRGELGDPIKMAEHLTESDFFKYKDAVFDLKSKKFVAAKKGAKGIPTREQAFNNSKLGVKKIGEEVSKIVAKSPNKKTYYGKDLEYYQPLLDDLDDLITFKSTDEEAMGAMIEKQLKHLKHSLDRPFETEDVFGEIVKEPQGVTLSEINAIKQKWQNESVKNYKSIDPTLSIKGNVQETIARGLKEFVEENVGKSSKRVRKLNNTAHQLYNAQKGLSPEIAAADASGLSASGINPFFGALYQIKNVGEKMLGGERGMLLRAGVGEAAENLPQYIKRPIEETANQVVPRTFAREFLGDEGREPDSIPEELVRKPFPRTSAELMENSDFVLAKIAQQAPMMFDAVKDVIEYNPEQIPDIMPALTQAAPHIFQKDKYNRFDGVILDPESKNMARRDTMMDDSLSNTEKIEIIDRLNRTGEF